MTDTTRAPLAHPPPPPVRTRHRPDIRAELRRYYGVETDAEVRAIAERTLAALAADERRAA